MIKPAVSEPQHFDPDAILPQPAAQAGSVVRSRCRAARIGDIADFAECLVISDDSCQHRLVFNTYRYCVHPQREVIIAQTLAGGLPPGR